MLSKKRGQSILEYILVLTAVIGVILWAASTVIKGSINTSYTNAQTLVTNVAGKLP